MSRVSTWTPVARSVLFGTVILVVFFVSGVALLIALNTSSPTGSFRDIGVVFAATIAATGAITAAFIAFQAGRHLEVDKDLRERRRRLDEERVKTEADLVTLHVTATVIDGIYQRVEELNSSAKSAINQKKYNEFCKAIAGLPNIGVPFPLIAELDVRFMRLEELTGIRNIQVHLDILKSEIEKAKDEIRMQSSIQKEIRGSLGDEAFFGALGYRAGQIEHYNSGLFKAIAPYVNQRRVAAIPDEMKLSMLLGDLKDNIEKSAVVSLNDALDRVRQLASQLLLDHVEAKDVRSSLIAVAKTIKDEDSIPAQE
tara:strand:- start:2100 stop:3035 length:936 start_codon:yes stop_codon:yes gene_type:complete